MSDWLTRVAIACDRRRFFLTTPDADRPALIACLALALLSPQVCAQAQPYPSKLIRLVTGSAPAGGADLTARAIHPKLAVALGAQMIVENRPGVAGMLANEHVAKAAPDGYTLLLQPGSFVTVSTQLNTKTAWDPTKLLAPIIQVSAYDFVMVMHPSVPARTLKELVAIARAKPGALSFVSTGVGSNFHLAAELFKLGTKIDMLHVPYKGSAQAIVDLVAGRAELMFIHVPVVLQHIKSGRLRAMGVTGPRRNALLPDVPSIGEALIKGYEITGWEGIYAPAGTPREIVAKLNETAAAVLASAELKEAWAAKAVEFQPNTPEQFTAKTRRDYESTAALIKAAGIKPET
jgi:tripartite-type tricarboxylate transporter receptor subunit TctC